LDITTIRHSLAHVMAKALLELRPGSKLAIGPSISNGFYYDLEIIGDFSTNNFIELENKMKKILKQDLKFEMHYKSIKEASDFYKAENNIYKIELIEDLEKQGEQSLSFYKLGDFVDLCKGPHVTSTKDIPKDIFKIDKLAGAYWRGDEKKPMLTRIYALCFETKEELETYISKREAALLRDHRKIGIELDLYMISEDVGKGLPMLLPKGATIRRILERFAVDEELKRGYLHVYTPVLGRTKLYEISGHLTHYKDSMYPIMDIEGVDYVLRPMSCPHHFMIYKNKPKSYRDLPVRYAEIASMYRKEKSGELTGLIRCMGFNLADGHVICTKDQLKIEFIKTIELVEFLMDKLGLSKITSYRASLRDELKEKYVADSSAWDFAESTLIDILNNTNKQYYVSHGDAAFYGPKLDIQLETVTGKDETIFTIQIDMIMADRFNLEYIDADGSAKKPIIIHRSSIGCMERILAFLIEHYAGAFPLWFAPVQVKLLSVSEKHDTYLDSIYNKLLENNIRVEKDTRNESIGKKIREARLQKIPYIIIIGDKEIENNTVTVRNRNTQNQNVLNSIDFINKIIKEDKDKVLELNI